VKETSAVFYRSYELRIKTNCFGKKVVVVTDPSYDDMFLASATDLEAAKDWVDRYILDREWDTPRIFKYDA
jgi:hypothetical protein